MATKIEELEEQAEPIDRLEKRLKLLERYRVRSYRDGRLSIDLSGPNEAKKKPTEQQEGEPLLRG